MKRSIIRAGVGLVAILAVGAPAFAQARPQGRPPTRLQIVQSLQIGVGGVFPRGLDSRVEDDVLVRNFDGEIIPGFSSLTDALAFEIGDFRSGQVFAEWNAAFGRHVEIGAGIGFYNRSVPTVYLDLVDENDRDIEQTLRLRVIPLSAVVRFLPFGRPGDVQPYVGAGIAALNYRYSEIGDFVDTTAPGLDIFEGRFVASGTTPGALLLGGVRFPLGGDVYGLTVEGRYQFGVGNTGGNEEGFVADKIDLSGGQLNFGLIIRF